MAQPISLKIPPRDPRQELLSKLESAPAEYAAALLDSYELLQQLHESGVFTLIRGALGAKDRIVEAAAAGANSEDAIRGIRNLIILGKTLGAIDPVVLEGTYVAIKDTFGDARTTPYQPPPLFSLAVNFASRDMRRGLGLLNRFLRNMGHQLKLRTQSNPSN
jgi:uncharacterized protein YjgD (DUF1641 family)